jgi:hypothetical protein
MARKQNPIRDISDTVSAWLGGNRGTVNPQVRRTISQTKEAAKVVDQFAAGGLGAALVSDAERMAATGSSTPSALYKTAAVNLAAGAVGAAAAKVAGKVASKVVTNRAAAATKAITPKNPEMVIYHGGSDPLTAGPYAKGYKPVDKRAGYPNVHMGTETAAVSRHEGRVGFDSEADVPLFRKSAIDRYEIANPKAVSKRRFDDNAFIDEEELADMREAQSRKFVQYYDDTPTPKNKILKYVNEVEDRYSVSYLVPKSRVESGDVVYRGSKSFENQFVENAYTSPRLNRLRDVQTSISANQGRIQAAGAAAGFVAPKKKGRGGGTKKK